MADSEGQAGPGAESLAKAAKLIWHGACELLPETACQTCRGVALALEEAAREAVAVFLTANGRLAAALRASEAALAEFKERAIKHAVELDRIASDKIKAAMDLYNDAHNEHLVAEAALAERTKERDEALALIDDYRLGGG